jgi:DNA replicative helicase MCM subunit Mcm2 (Cdc46/Mcm family)
MPREKVDKINAMIEIIKKLDSDEGSAKMQRVIEEAEKAGFDAGTAKKYIEELEKRGDVYSPRPGILRIVRHDSE